MNGSQYQHPGGGFEDRGNDERDRRDAYNQSYPSQQQQPQPQQQSPPTSASPFAFAPPPLSSLPGPGSSRPALPAYHSEPTTVGQQYAYYQKPQVAHHNSYPYATSAPMGYRSYSGETEKQSPQQSHLTRTPSLNVLPQPGSMQSQSSPGAGSPFTYQRPGANPQYSTPINQPAASPRAGVYPQNYYTTPYSQPASADMPRSLSYPSNYSQPYPTYLPSMSAPLLQQPSPSGLPPLMRHNTMGAPTDLRTGPSLGYSFANRLPLVDRPFKCDECVQSFNRNHDLKRHKRIHLSVKPFGCDKCGKTFSRKDALRRHWLVKGCRGEEGATAPITPMYPINQTPALSPPTPPGNISPVESGFPSTSSYGHPSAPPPINTLQSRHSSDTTQIIVTPDEIAAQQQMARTSISDTGLPPALEEPLVLDTTMGNANGRGDVGVEGQNSYFDGVVGLKQDGTAVIDKSQGNASPYSRFPSSPNGGVHHHPYRRPLAIPSPGRSAQQDSPTGSYQSGSKLFSPSSLGQDGKPIFAMPFTPSGQTYLPQQDGLLAPPLEPSAQKMEKQLSADAMPETWQRWHRPSFPFPAPPGISYNFDSSSPIDVSGNTQGYGQ